jgi:hypothetical protein
MLLPLAGALIIGLPSLLLAIWFSWLSHRHFQRGGLLLVARTWIVVLISIAGALTALYAPFVVTGFGLLYNALTCFCIFAVGGAIPSAVIALVVSCLTYWLKDNGDEYELNIVLIMVLGTVSGLLAAVPALYLCMEVMNTFWHS